MQDNYVYIIIALLPLAALMLVAQRNPYNALVMRGILGAIAVLVYIVLGAADVALTEALVGTMLAITLYVVAVRSSLVMRVGVLKDTSIENTDEQPWIQLIADLKRIAKQYHLRLELLSYADSAALEQALIEKEVHATCVEALNQTEQPTNERQQPYRLVTRVRRLYDIFQTELSASLTSLDYMAAVDSGEKH